MCRFRVVGLTFTIDAVAGFAVSTQHPVSFIVEDAMKMGRSMSSVQ